MKKLTLESLLDVMGELLSDEISIAVANKKEYVYYRPSKRIDLKIRPGDPLKVGTIAHKAIAEKQKASEFIDRDIFGTPYHGMAVPFHHEGILEGCVMAIYPAYTDGKSVITYVMGNDFSGTHKNTLQEFEYLLPRDAFVRCHRSYIVNVHHIKEIFPDTHSTFILAMDDGAMIPVSQSYSSYFRKLLGF